MMRGPRALHYASSESAKPRNSSNTVPTIQPAVSLVGPWSKGRSHLGPLPPLFSDQESPGQCLAAVRVYKISYSYQR